MELDRDMVVGKPMVVDNIHSHRDNDHSCIGGVDQYIPDNCNF